MYEKLEATRKHYRNLMVINIVIIVVACMFMFRVMIMNPFYMVLIMVVVFVILYNCEKISNKYRREYKELFVKDALSLAFDNVECNFESGISEEEIEAYGLLVTENRFYSNDYITGMYKGSRFTRSDVTIKKVIHTGKRTTTITTFSGPYMIFEFDKKFNSDVLVKEKGASHRSSFFFKDELEKVKFESVEFNKKFNVYSKDGHTAFYLLTPQYMEKLMEFDSRFEGVCYFGFINGKFHLALYNNEDMFETSVFTEVDENEINRFSNEIELMKSMMDFFI